MNRVFAIIFTIRFGILVLFVGLYPLQAFAQEEPEAVRAFKDFLSKPPCIKEIRFIQLQREPNPPFSYVGGMCNGDFFLRPLGPGQGELSPVSITNAAPVGWFAGSVGQKKWQIGGFDITEVYPANSARHPIEYGAKVGESLLRAVLAMGTTALEPGTFVWNGNRFHANVTALVSNSSHGSAPLEGEITVRDGVVAEMRVARSGRFHFVYKNTGQLPIGIPWSITHGKNETNYVNRYLLEKLVLADRISELDYFEPYRHVDPKLASVTVISNSTSKLIHDNTMALVAAMQKKRPSNAKVLLVRVAVIGFSLLTLFLLYKKLLRPASDQIPPHRG